MEHKLHILAIAAHPDDIELGCAGIIVKHVTMGHKVGIVDLTEGELGSRGTVEERYEEAANAAQIMGVSVRENAQIRDGFFENNEATQKHIIKYIRKYQPDIVLTNAPQDRHPDHGRACKLVQDACFLSGLRMIETHDDNGIKQEPWRPKRVFSFIQDMPIEPTFIVDISSFIGVKMNAIEAYKSQFYQASSSNNVKTYISTKEFTEQIKYRDALWGKRIGVAYAEGLISANIIGVSHLDNLIYPEMP